MKRPDKIKIFGDTYGVIYRDELHLKDGTFLFGEIDHVDRIIKICDSMNIHVEKVALIHEALHGATHITGHHDIDSTVDERLVQCFSQVFIRILMDNPGIVEYLIQEEE